jgi:hypothetical protein
MSLSDAFRTFYYEEFGLSFENGVKSVDHRVTSDVR